MTTFCQLEQVDIKYFIGLYFFTQKKLFLYNTAFNNNTRHHAN